MEVIIHHWDTDGITTAAIVAKALNIELHNLTPPIGEYSFDERIWSAISRAERVYVVDLNVPQEVERIKVETIFIDHHIQPRIKNPLVRQINPALEGKQYPSASLVASEYLNFWNAWSALGAVGDIGARAFNDPLVKKLLKQEGLTEREALRLAELIDSNYISMDRKGVEEAVKVLLENPIKELLSYEPWVKKAERIRAEIEEAISGVEVKGGMAFLEFESDLNIISKIARKLVWDLGYDVALVVNRNFHGKAQVYLRISPGANIDVTGITKELRKRGFNAGGKKEVIGCICERDEVEDVLEIVTRSLHS
ncbi:DHH family phosphoesterase [Pyrococcus kukulkanii]|uniref:DHH family phosphoesterase n=1 Tax=Pyrococcus kukulkanii TaxID=1609559 RepID=UPI003563A37C